MALAMPDHYVQPYGTPYYWGVETSGVLPAAVMAYLEGRESPSQLRLTIDYCAYLIRAPCWRSDPSQALEDLRRTIARVTTRAGLAAWLCQCLALGIDPL
jgi:hypothetical protein